MLHTSLTIERLVLESRDLPLRHATLMVVARAETPELDWEVVAHTIEPEPVAAGIYNLTLRCLDGLDDTGDLAFRQLAGSAFLVRSVERALVFRGSGMLDGFERSLLSRR